MSNRVVIKPNGPLVLYGEIRIETADGEVIEQTDNAFLCRCGHSNNKPFCDGEHKRIGFHDPAQIETVAADSPRRGRAGSAWIRGSSRSCCCRDPPPKH